MNDTPPELGSEKFARWASAVWPYLVGAFGMLLIFLNTIVFPPPNTITVGAGVSCIVGFGAVKLIRFERPSGD